MSEILQSLKCSQCGGGPLTDNGNGTITCPYCSSTFAHPERVCPRCETVNEQEVRECVTCGQVLKESCVRCGTLNWAQAQFCQRCGAPLSILEHIADRRSRTDAERLRSLQADAARIKADTARSSQERLDRMWAQEHARLAKIAENKTRQQSQERMLWMVAATGIVILLIVIVVLSVATQLRLP